MTSRWCVGARVALLLSASIGLVAQSTPPLRREPVSQRVRGALIAPIATAAAERVIEFAAPGKPQQTATIDTFGQFVSPPLTTGPHQLSLRLAEPRRRPACPPSVAWLGEATVAVGHIDVGSSQLAPISVPAPPLATLAFEVSASGQPAADVDVFVFRLNRENDAPVTRSGPRGMMEQNPDDIDAPRRSLTVRTDCDGRARLVCAAPGRWQVYVRHADGAAATGPHDVEIRPEHIAAQATCPHALALPTSKLRGRVATLPTTHKLADHRLPNHELEVQLYRRTVADDSPFTCHDTGTSQQCQVPSATPDRDGRFQFAWLPAASWVVRLVARYDDAIVAQCLATTDGKNGIDLGDLAATPSFDVALVCGGAGVPAGQHDTAFQVQWLPTDDGPPVFVSNTWPATRQLRLPRLRPGRYRARRLTDETEAGSWGVIGEPFGPAVDFVVDTRGVVTPATIMF